MGDLTSVQIKALIDGLLEQIADLQINLVETVEREKAEEEAAKPKSRFDFDLWREYYALEDQKIKPLAPVLVIPEDADQYGDWFFDGEVGFIYRPILDIKERLLGNDRAQRYAAFHSRRFSYKYLTIPEGFTPSEEYHNLLMANYNDAQWGRVIGLGRSKSGYRETQAHSEFEEDGMKRAVDGAEILGHKMLSAGNPRYGLDGAGMCRYARKAFEKWWRPYGPGERGIKSWATARLYRLDALYNQTEKDSPERAEFLSLNPGYEPIVQDD